jgi:hypothetical protein
VGFEWFSAAVDGSSVAGKNELTTAIVIAVISSGIISSIITTWFGRRKTAAETTGLVADTYSHMLKDMRETFDKTEQRLDISLARIAKLERREQFQRRRIAQLEAALRDANISIPEVDGHPPVDG